MADGNLGAAPIPARDDASDPAALIFDRKRAAP
jgi:hypothetical protein